MASALPAHAGFSWDNCGSTSDPFAITALSVGADPTPPEMLPARWEVIYDTETNKILKASWVFGRAYGAPELPGGCRIEFPTNSVIGSANYTTSSPSVLPAGTYNLPLGSWGFGWSITATQTIAPAAVEIQIEKKVFGVWIEIPAVSIGDTWDNPAWATAGDFYLKFTLKDAAGNRLGCYEIYFSGQPISAIGVDLADEIEALAAAVQSLVSDGALLPAGGRSLFATLNTALSALERGYRDAARDGLRAFINQVGALVRAGRLSAAEGQALVGAAQAIIDLLA